LLAASVKSVSFFGSPPSTGTMRTCLFWQKARINEWKRYSCIREIFVDGLFCQIEPLVGNYIHVLSFSNRSSVLAFWYNTAIHLARAGGRGGSFGTKSRRMMVNTGVKSFCSQRQSDAASSRFFGKVNHAA